MADDSEKSPDPGASTAKPAGRPRSKRRWLLKFFAWCAVMILVVAAVVSLAGYLVYRNLTYVANRALEEFVTPWEIEVGEIDIGKRGFVRIDNLKVQSPTNGTTGDPSRPLFEAKSIELDYDLQELRTRKKVQAIRIESPMLRVDDTLLANRQKAEESEPEAGGELPALNFLGRFTDSLTITGGKAEVDLEKLPPISLNWNVETGAIDFASEEWLTAEPIGINLSDLRVGAEGEHAAIEALELSLKIRGDLKRLEAGALKLDEPLIRITPETLEAFSAKTGTAADAEKTTEPDAPKPEPEKNLETSAGAMAVLLETMQIDRARFELSGFDDLPEVRFESTLQWDGLQFKDGELEIGDGQPLTLAIDNIRIDGGESPAVDGMDRLGNLRRLEVVFLPKDLIEQRRIESILLDQPVIRWNAETASRFSGKLSSLLEKILDKKPENSASDEQAASAAADTTEQLPLKIGSFALRRGRVELADVSAGEMPIPQVGFDADVQLGNLEIGGADGFTASDDQSLTIRNLQIDTPEIAGEEDAAERSLLKADEISGQLNWESFKEQKRIKQFKIAKPNFLLTDASLAPWLERLAGFSKPGSDSPDPAAVPAPAGESESTGAVPPKEELTPELWVVDELAIEEGVFRLDTSAFGDRLPKAQGTFEVANLDPDATGNHHPYRATFQRLRVRSRAIATDAGESPEVPEKPDADAVKVEGNPQKLGGLFPDGATAEPEKKSGGIPEEDVGFIRELTIDFTAEGVQREKQIDRIVVDGGVLNIGDGLERLVTGKVDADADAGAEPQNEKAAGEAAEKPPAEAAAAPKPEPLAQNEAPAEADPPDDNQAPAQAAAAPAENANADADAPVTEPKAGWSVGEISVTRSRVQFEALIPQIAGLEFDIETQLHDVPLNGGGLLSRNRIQKVELSDIRIRDPYGGFQPVANLPTIFVEFTLAGMVDQRIKKIDLIGPELFVGEPLFQWIDYQRRFRKQNEGAGIGFKADATPIDPPASDATDWEIEEINAHFGKIIIAPVGYPIGVVPFPFEATTKLSQGKIDLKLKIPDQDHVYRFPDLELDLYGLDGKIEFNVPIDQEDNNLVQTFNLRKAIWKQYEATDLWMSVSFDAEVIHGEFGGSAYEGYAKGAFNVYLKELGKWDAWIGGTEMDMGPISDVVTPENFRMDGVVNCKLVSEGEGLIFGETWGEIEAVTPGQINVTKLDDLLENLPESWSVMKKSATQLGLETLKEFDYDEGRADLYFVDRDGWFRLNLQGPTGSRKFNLYAHDWRKKKNETDPGEEDTKLDTSSIDPSNENETTKKSSGFALVKEEGSIDE